MFNKTKASRKQGKAQEGKSGPRRPVLAGASRGSEDSAVASPVLMVQLFHQMILKSVDQDFLE